MYFYLLIISVLSLRKALSAETVTCSSGYLVCDDQTQCIFSDEWCDDEVDCSDESDENYCQKFSWFNQDPNACDHSDIHFKCHVNGHCIPTSALCNGYDDCPDGSDEYDYECEGVSTTATEYEYSGANTTATDFEYSEESTEKTLTDETDYEDNKVEEDYQEYVSQEETTTDASPASTTLSSTTTTSNSASRKQFETSKTTQVPVFLTKAPNYPTSILRPWTKHHLSHPSPSINQSITKHPDPHFRRPVTYDRRKDTWYKIYGTRPSIARPPIYRDTPLTYDPRYPTNHHNLNGDRYYGRYNATLYPVQRTYRRPYDSNDQNGGLNWPDMVVTSMPYNRETSINERFYFSNKYADLFKRSNKVQLRKAQSWLLEQREVSGDWGKNSARALIALSSVNNSYPYDDNDYEIMKRKFTVQLAVELLKKRSGDYMSTNRLASSINALWAVCENPRDFDGMDLTELLRAQIQEAVKKRARVNPFVHLSLCLSGRNLTSAEINLVMKQMQPTKLDEVSKDSQSMAIQTFACYLQQQAGRADVSFRMSLQKVLNNAVAKLLERTLDDGSFGSVYSTALATQALLSVNDSLSWDAEKTMRFLSEQQLEDGSFGDLLATYYVMPVLSGRSLMHIRNTRCLAAPGVRDLTPSEILEYSGSKRHIHYSIYFGHPLQSSRSVRVLVPRGISFFDVMRVAEYQDKDFKFGYQLGEKGVHVYSLSGLPNDAEGGLSWHLYVKQESDPRPQQLNPVELYTGDLREFLPVSSQHVVFWYHPVMAYRTL